MRLGRFVICPQGRMNLLADEDIERQIVERLRQGHVVLYIAEMEPGVPDDVVLERANGKTALLVRRIKISGSWC